MYEVIGVACVSDLCGRCPVDALTARLLPFGVVSFPFGGAWFSDKATCGVVEACGTPWWSVCPSPEERRIL